LWIGRWGRVLALLMFPWLIPVLLWFVLVMAVPLVAYEYLTRGACRIKRVLDALKRIR
jgi:hypothetical protein